MGTIQSTIREESGWKNGDIPADVVSAYAEAGDMGGSSTAALGTYIIPPPPHRQHHHRLARPTALSAATPNSARYYLQDLRSWFCLRQGSSYS